MMRFDLEMSCMNVDVAQAGLQSHTFKLEFVSDIEGPVGGELLQSHNSCECNEIHLFQVILIESLLIPRTNINYVQINSRL